jgi:hypothetical protein
MNNKNNNRDSVRRHLKKYLRRDSLSVNQIKNIATGYGVDGTSLHCLPRDLVRQGFLIRSGSSFRISSWVSKM